MNVMKMFSLEGKGALVTGAGNRIGYGAQCAGAYFVCGGEFLAGIDADGLDLFFLFAERNALAYPELPAGDLQPGQAAALLIPGNFIHPGTKIGILPVFRGELIQNLQ